MFGLDPIIPLNLLLNMKVKYLNTAENILSLEALKNMYHISATSLELD